MVQFEGCLAGRAAPLTDSALIYWRLIAAGYCHRWAKQTLLGSHGFLRHQSEVVPEQGGRVLLASVPSTDFTLILKSCVDIYFAKNREN